MKRARITTLDGFRAIAIISVMFYHFFSRWIPPENQTSLYPYNNAYNYFGYGYLGVQFFFIISGFVIFFTLDNTNCFSDFWKKRMIRLLPSMIIATILTFIIFRLLDSAWIFPDSHRLRNFIPSCTFVAPEILNKMLQSLNIRFEYINGSYWSLWPEIQFYLFASAMYYLNKKNFVRNFVCISLVLILINHLLLNIQGSNRLNISLPANILNITVWVQQVFNLANYLPYFGIGALSYILFKNKQKDLNTSFFIRLSLVVFILFAVYLGASFVIRIISCSMFLLFFCFIYYPDKLYIFENKSLAGIGECSYFLYLIHENIGVLLISKFGYYFLPVGFLFTLLLMYSLTMFSRLYTEKVDKRINLSLKKALLKC